MEHVHFMAAFLLNKSVRFFENIISCIVDGFINRSRDGHVPSITNTDCSFCEIAGISTKENLMIFRIIGIDFFYKYLIYVGRLFIYLGKDIHAIGIG